MAVWAGQDAMWRPGGSAEGAFYGKMKTMIEQLRDKAMQLCLEHGITVRPYAGGWWLIGEKLNRVVGELAGLCVSDITPLPVAQR